MIRKILALLEIRFCKEFLGDSFFRDAVDTDIHEERKNESTTKFAAKGRICDSAILCFLFIFLTASNCFASPKINELVQFKITTFNHKEFDLSNHKKVTIINFWASWCSECRKEIMVLQNIKKRYGNKVEIIGVALDKNAKKLAKNLNYENGSIDDMISNIVEPDAIPLPYIINKDGKVAAIFDDENIEISEELFSKIIDPIL